MRKCVCTKCGREFLENDSNPAIHYSDPATVCSSCERPSPKTTTPVRQSTHIPPDIKGMGDLELFEYITRLYLHVPKPHDPITYEELIIHALPELLSRLGQEP